MKTISKLQQDIRLIKKEISVIDKRLDKMSNELAYYNSAMTEDSKYKRIYKIAKTMPTVLHPIVKANRVIKSNYFGILLMIVTEVDSLNERQLLFLQRIILADKYANQLDTYIGNLGTITAEKVIFQMEESVKNEYAYQLLLDSIILVNLADDVSRRNYELIANISLFLNINKEELRSISMVASALLKQNVESLLDADSVIDLDRKYGFYLSELSGWNEKAKKAYIQKLVGLLVEHINEKNKKGKIDDKNEL